MNLDFLSFENYLVWLREKHEAEFGLWVREHTIATILREHGGVEFRDYEIPDYVGAEPPRPLRLPDRPDLSQLGLSSRVSLKFWHSGFDDEDYLCNAQMLVIGLDGDRVDGYIFDGDAPRQRIHVSTDKIFEVLPPIEENSVDDSEIPF